MVSYPPTFRNETPVEDDLGRGDPPMVLRQRIGETQDRSLIVLPFLLKGLKSYFFDSVLISVTT